MAIWLTQTIVPLAWCWRIERRDGVVIGLTTHDSTIEIDGLAFASAPGIRPSAIHQRTGLDGASFEIEGALNSAAISAGDLIQGRWDGAAITLIIANWQSPDVDPVIIASGRVGAVSSDGVSFTAELSGRDASLDAPFTPETTPECRAALGDRRCGVAMGGRTHRAKVVLVDSEGIVFDQTWPDGALDFGRLRWLSGVNRGLSSTIIVQSGGRVRIAAAHEGVAVVGAYAELSEGCDKRAATCSGRFGNIANFRGEPHLPGLDLLTRFPGG
ncbi:MAG: DUF2163 domain-containing protein [Sphingopyxis sp.]